MKFVKADTEIIVQFCKSASASGGLRPLRPLDPSPELCPWTQLGNPVSDTPLCRPNYTAVAAYADTPLDEVLLLVNYTLRDTSRI